MNELRNNSEQNVMAALEAKPRVSVPADFAARVVASLPAAPKPRRVPRFGRAMLLLTALCSLIALALLAPHAQPRVTSLAFVAEMLVVAELAGIGAWLALRRDGF